MATVAGGMLCIQVHDDERAERVERRCAAGTLVALVREPLAQRHALRAQLPSQQ